MEGIQVSTRDVGTHNQISVIKVGGYIDTTTSSEVERALNGLLKQGRFQIIIDLGNVDYISSAGWGILISEIKSIRENNGDLKLVKMIPDVYEIFELLEFHHILDVYDTMEEAVARFEESQYVEMVPGSNDAPAKSPFTIQPEPAHSMPGKGAGDETLHARAPQPQPSQGQGRARTASRSKRDLSTMTVEDKIKYIVAHEPDLGAYKINKRLNSARFGFTRVGWFGVRNWLNKLNLRSRKERRKFAETYQGQVQ